MYKGWLDKRKNSKEREKWEKEIENSEKGKNYGRKDVGHCWVFFFFFNLVGGVGCEEIGKY